MTNSIFSKGFDSSLTVGDVKTPVRPSKTINENDSTIALPNGLKQLVDSQKGSVVDLKGTGELLFITEDNNKANSSVLLDTVRDIELNNGRRIKATLVSSTKDSIVNKLLTSLPTKIEGTIWKHPKVKPIVDEVKKTVSASFTDGIENNGTTEVFMDKVLDGIDTVKLTSTLMGSDDTVIHKFESVTSSEVSEFLTLVNSYLLEDTSVNENTQLSIIDKELDDKIANVLLSLSLSKGTCEITRSLLDHYSYSSETLLEMLKYSIDYGDYRTVNELTITIGTSSVLAKYPNIVRDLLRVINIPSDIPPSGYKNLLSELLGILGQINPNWLTYNRGGVEVTNISSLYQASEGVKTLMSLDFNLGNLINIGGHYNELDIKELVSNDFPLVAIK